MAFVRQTQVGAGADEVRAYRQPRDRQGPRSRRAALTACTRRQRDRIEMPFAAAHESVHGTKRTWHDVGLKSVMRLGADITIASLRMTVIRARCVCDATKAINRSAKGRRSHRIYSNP